MKKYQVTAIGELNADLILNKIDGFPVIGKEIFANQMTLTLGSSTAIFAANIASLGIRTAFVGMIGDDILGSLVENSLKLKKVSTEYLIKSSQVSTGATVVLNYGEDRANVTYQGAMDKMTFEDINSEIFDRTQHIHISSIFMQSGLKQDLKKLLSFAQSQHITVSLDMQWDPTETWDFDYQTYLPLINIFLPNENELKALTQTVCLEDAILKVKPYLRQAMVVKMGHKGSLLITKDEDPILINACINEHVIDTIGAGDSFNAGFIYAYVQGLTLTECQRIGNLAGAINTTAAGGTGAFVSIQEIEKRAFDFFNQHIK